MIGQQRINLIARILYDEIVSQPLQKQNFIDY